MPSGPILPPLGGHAVDAYRRPPTGAPLTYQSFQIAAHPSTHLRSARCDEVACRALADGWTVRCDETKHVARRYAWYVRHRQRRRFVETVDETGLTVFTFHAGQPCFADGRDVDAHHHLGVTPHRVPLERDPDYVRLDGDYRHATLAHVYDRADQFADDLHHRTTAYRDLVLRG